MLPVTESAFETACFGGPVWRYNYEDSIDPAEVAAAATSRGVKLVMCRIPADTGDAASAALEQAGFRLIERLVTLERSVAQAPEVLRPVEVAHGEDRQACVDIAVAALRQDRFHADALIDPRIADALKAEWVSNNLMGRAELNLVARDDHGRVVGFNQLSRTGRQAVIDLIAVAPWAQAKGYGKALVAAGLQAFALKADTMRVGTQGTNDASLALYRSAGFKIVNQQLTYHLSSA